ncbi:MAG: protein kinase domain-containing protein [Gemmatimonadales bacterium]
MTAEADRLTGALADRYRIEGEVGHGGMAAVYLAYDLRHERRVAVKVLKPELSAVLGGDRFLQEIRVTAHLQHPHILPLFDSGSADGLLYYVMPYVEGESLRTRLAREKQLPVAEAVGVAKGVASALDYAHRHGVIHRDIKPENILLHDGQPLVADFGIALAVSRAGGTRVTETGLSLGTPHYMSPEQATADRDLTPRSDVYALGAVLYEMLVGDPPHTGSTAQAIIAKVVTERPRPIRPARPSVSPELEAAVLCALEKIPADRFASAAEFASALEPGTTLARSGGRYVTTTLPAPCGGRPWIRAVAAGVVLVAALAGAFAAGRALVPKPAEPPPSRLEILAPGLGGAGATGLQRQIGLTPDGGTVLYTAIMPDGNNRILRRPLDAATATPIPGLEGNANPSVSPDGRWLLATYLGRGVFRSPVEGGQSERLVMTNGNGAFTAWGPDGALWVSPGSAGNGLARVEGRDSLRPHLTERTAELQLHQVLPDGRTAIMLKKRAAAAGPAVLLDLEAGAETPLLDAQVVEVRYTAGHLVYVLADGTMQAVPFDASSRRIAGSAVTIATGVSLTGTGIAQMAVAPNGTVAYIGEQPRTLVLVDRHGAMRPAIADERNFHAPLFSPDGRRLSVDFTSADGRDVWILALDQGTLSRATFDRDGHDATWSPDGRFITYSSARSGALGVYRTRPGSTERAESLLATPNLTYTGVWLPDASALVTVAEIGAAGVQTDLVLLSPGQGELRPLMATPFTEGYPAVSHDGRWLAFVSDQSGQPQVYVRPLAGDQDPVQVSQSGGSEPVWGRDGRQLFYRAVIDGRGELVAATVRTTPQFEVAARQSLFPVDEIAATQPHSNYDISPDGQTFAMVRRSPSTHITVIQNLPALVQRLRGSTAAR